MVVLALALILLTAGVPSFNQIIKNNRLVAQANALSGLMASARPKRLPSARLSRYAAAATAPPAMDNGRRAGFHFSMSTEMQRSIPGTGTSCSSA
ncbi:MAG: hypothetical protein IPL00_11745 [Gammaproteobacteria bacterium]|nr:hypothetical protein [Gammaproteobacteria bacterium]